MAKDFKLVVTQQFGDRAVGDTITGASEMAAVLETHPHAVVRAPVDDPNPDAEAAAAEKAPAKTDATDKP